MLLVIVQQRKHFRIGKLLAAVEEVEFDHEAHAGDLGAQRPGQLGAGIGGAAGGQQVVDNDHFLAGLDGVFVYLQGIQAVLELVAPFDGLGGRLARLAEGDEAGVEAVGQRRSEDEAAGLDGQHGIDLGVEVVLGERVNECGEADFVLEQGGDVVKQDAFLGKIRDFADQLLEVITIGATPGLHRYHAPSMRNVVRPATASAGASSTSSTRAARGPLCNLLRRAACCSALPVASTSTVPSMLLRTQPASPSWRAS